MPCPALKGLLIQHKISQVCNDVYIEPHLQPITKETPSLGLVIQLPIDAKGWEGRFILMWGFQCARPVGSVHTTIKCRYICLQSLKQRT